MKSIKQLIEQHNHLNTDYIAYKKHLNNSELSDIEKQKFLQLIDDIYQQMQELMNEIIKRDEQGDKNETA